MQTRFERIRTDDYRLPAECTRRLFSPALLVYLDRVRENIRRTIALAGDADRWRPHIKTTKIPRVYAEMIRAGVRHYKCATLREAETLLQVAREEGIEDVDLLFAHPLIGPALDRLADLAAASPGASVSVLCEDPEAVETIDPSLGLFVDIDPGMHRTGVDPEHPERIRAIAEKAGSRFRGLHYYDGHIHGTTAAARREQAHRGYHRLLEIVEALSSHADVPEIVTSGTPAFPYALDFEPFRTIVPIVHRVSPGTVVFHDLRSEQQLEDLDLVPAALVFARVVSRPLPDRVTADAGSKSIAAEAGDPCAFAIGYPGLEALTPSEEHLPFSVRSGPRPERGQHLYLVPRHVCPTVNLAEQALLVDGDDVTVSPVRARAHELLS
ncbi:MAG: D-TA family PLP-dependent enzyme [Acidobacteria bacterium]|nr:D-TA family PLP-dependent enzyme [Acidobacteriota bacterium]NIM60678.1 D-TA family PLP-dependent enzyme [Acidobacteriota bacterium]NIO58638.1 D-TA family PLP-dependent enzyme [Acidobacteriota bacterium]NIQ29694.1 D-TA family PLP-dependent enzyme [Acidobacteriota bacterium]NIQ84411.1 D-TA family PLP-dependent enzyme [Acidobacteriota bacterium]